MSQMYNKSSNWAKVIIIVVVLLIAITLFKSTTTKKEGYEQRDKFEFKTGPDIYDDFYATIYDHLVYNNILDDYAVGEIINKTTPTNQSIILDIGSGTGNVVAALSDKGLNAEGVDISQSMVKQAKENYPNYDFKQGDVRNAMLFNSGSFTHILCLYFTIYYIQDKAQFFSNCFNWLMPGGHLVVHIVDRDQFDPIIPPANPLITLSPQRYAPKRVTHSKVTFDDFKYAADFQLDNQNNTAKFVEKFSNKDSGKTFRKQEHEMFMESEDDILTMAQNTGFIVMGKVDLIKCGYEYQYLYVLQKPE
jgi:SAM-dependent methyltransferase